MSPSYDVSLTTDITVDAESTAPSWVVSMMRFFTALTSVGKIETSVAGCARLLC